MLWPMAVCVWQMNPVVVLFVVGLAWALIISLLVRPEDVSGAVRRGAAKKTEEEKRLGHSVQRLSLSSRRERQAERDKPCV